jgi:GTPase SAR1 family protein
VLKLKFFSRGRPIKSTLFPKQELDKMAQETVKVVVLGSGGVGKSALTGN